MSHTRGPGEARSKSITPVSSSPSNSMLYGAKSLWQITSAGSCAGHCQTAPGIPTRSTVASW